MTEYVFGYLTTGRKENMIIRGVSGIAVTDIPNSKWDDLIREHRGVPIALFKTLREYVKPSTGATIRFGKVVALGEKEILEYAEKHKRELRGNIVSYRVSCRTMGAGDVLTKLLKIIKEA